MEENTISLNDPKGGRQTQVATQATQVAEPSRGEEPKQAEIPPPSIEMLKMEPQRLVATASMKKILERYVRLCRREKRIKEGKEKAKIEVLRFCEGKPSVINWGQEQLGKLIAKEHTSFDVKALAAVEPELAEKFTRKTPFLELRCS